MPSIDVKNMKGENIRTIELRDEVFNSEVNLPLIQEVVLWQLAKRRSGTSSTKKRSDVRGGGRKPHSQKGTGRARQGSIRAPHFRGGGVVFGPHPRDYSYTIPATKRRKALISVLSMKFKEGLLSLFDEVKVESHKTRGFHKFLQDLDIENAIFIVDEMDENLSLSVRNIPEIKVLPVAGLNVYELLCYERVFLTLPSLDRIYERVLR